MCVGCVSIFILPSYNTHTHIKYNNLKLWFLISKAIFVYSLLCFIILYVTPKGSTKNSWLFEDNVFIIQIFKLIMYLMNIFVALIWVLLFSLCFSFFFIKIVKRIHEQFLTRIHHNIYIFIYIVFQYLTKTFFFILTF